MQLTGKQQFLQQLHTTPTVYITDPANMADFDAWAATFNLDDHEADISGLVDTTPSLQAMEANLVPRVVNRATFWARYFYHIHVYDSQQQERARIKHEASRRLLQQATDAESLAWDDDDNDQPPDNSNPGPLPELPAATQPPESAPAPAAEPEAQAGTGLESDDSWLMAGGSDDSDKAGQIPAHSSADRKVRARRIPECDPLSSGALVCSGDSRCAQACQMLTT